MYLALRFRTGKGGINRNGPQIHVTVGFLWFEGANDLHVQFDGPGEDNSAPPVKGDDYLAPHPKTGKPTVLYSLEIHSGVPCETKPAPRGYMKKLKEHWKF